MDLAERPPQVPAKVGNRYRGPWKAQLADRTLRPVECEVARLLLSKKKASGFQGAESDVEELSHSGLTEDSEESGGGVVGKTGKGESGGRTPGDSGGSRKPSRSQVGERSAPTSPVTEAKQATEI
ncbi:hypothetical protein PF011_g15063 [Phytophthora fragariae]|uniref:Uncharacterized protein n=1 Tax=Phytophthora fragariae TaxID=53985 RepID=A0A6A3JYH1_9STRA|nr:hypothetical protein PF011_g15063 [Phytophthora fragariae]